MAPCKRSTTRPLSACSSRWFVPELALAARDRRGLCRLVWQLILVRQFISVETRQHRLAKHVQALELGWRERVIRRIDPTLWFHLDVPALSTDMTHPPLPWGAPSGLPIWLGPCLSGVASYATAVDRPQSCSEAMRAPSTSDVNLAHMTSGCTRGAQALNVPKPQSGAAITFSRPTIR